MYIYSVKDKMLSDLPRRGKTTLSFVVKVFDMLKY